MSIAQAFLSEFEQEVKTTRKFLERLPEDKLAWKPHEKSHTAGELGLHIAGVPGGVVMVSCAPKMSQPETIESRPGKGPDEEAIQRRTDRGHSA